ncbi:hypothetical protein [Mesorhizobium sp.]|uniref:alpha/beta hydrolase family protein n=1 Tax=Mesorhizobium sp. TaxID=1871066 RepID=UPI0025B8BA21|nr:hypothetical protein [Mesorhizobium sp.]
MENLLLPKNRKPGPLPTIVEIHGGAAFSAKHSFNPGFALHAAAAGVGGPLKEERFRQLAIDRSPLFRLGRPTTPTLIIHGEFDRWTPLGQGQEFYSALLERGVPAELVVRAKGTVFRGKCAPAGQGTAYARLVQSLCEGGVLMPDAAGDSRPAPVRHLVRGVIVDACSTLGGWTGAARPGSFDQRHSAGAELDTEADVTICMVSTSWWLVAGVLLGIQRGALLRYLFTAHVGRRSGCIPAGVFAFGPYSAAMSSARVQK